MNEVLTTEQNSADVQQKGLVGTHQKPNEEGDKRAREQQDAQQ